MKELDILILFLILLLIYKLINNRTHDIENFDETKIKTGEFAQERLKEFNENLNGLSELFVNLI